MREAIPEDTVRGFRTIGRHAEGTPRSQEFEFSKNPIKNKLLAQNLQTPWKVVKPSTGSRSVSRRLTGASGSA